MIAMLPSFSSRWPCLTGGKAAGGKGGKTRMAALTPQERKELARKAAQARWAKAKKKTKA
jgi:hypothetical protein